MIEIIIEEGFCEKFPFSRHENKLADDFFRFLQRLASPLTIYIDFPRFEKMGTLVSKKDIFLALLTRDPHEIKQFGVIQELLSNDKWLRGNVLKMFFVDKTENECEEMRKKTGYEFICVNNFIEKWKNYYFDSDRDDLKLNVTPNTAISPRFIDYTIFNNFKHPVLSIIVIDPYLFVDYDNKVFLKSKNNLIQIITNLINNSPYSDSLEIFITTANEKMLSNEMFEKIYEQIEYELSPMIKNLQLHLYIYEDVPDHVRGIITNYWFIKSGKGFNILDENGKLTHQHKDDIEFNMLFYKTTRNIIQERVIDFYAFVKEATLKNNGIRNGVPRKRIFGDLKNNESVLMSSLKNFLNDESIIQ